MSMDAIHGSKSLDFSEVKVGYVRSDAGRSASRRPHQKNDCTVRALALSLGLPYDDAYDRLKEAGRRCGGRFDMGRWLDAQPWASKIPFPAVKGQPRMNPVEFRRRYPVGTFVCKVAKHVFVVIDGVVMDDTPVRGDRCIYTAWYINQEK